jgi:hypothetical protein
MDRECGFRWSVYPSLDGAAFAVAGARIKSRIEGQLLIIDLDKLIVLRMREVVKDEDLLVPLFSGRCATR